MRDRRLRKLLLGLAGVGAAAVAGLAGLTALVLRSDWLLERIDGDPGSLFVSFTGARASLVPGRVRFASLTLRSRDSNVEWEARLEDVTVDVALPALALRRFHAKTVRAGALVFRLRERLARDEATPPRLARYPRIAGFPDPPLRDPPAPAPPPGDPWRVVLDDLRVALVREIWVDSWRWTGDGSVAGGMFLRSGIEAEVLPSGVVVRGGVLRWGDTVVSRETAGTVRAALPRFDVRTYHGNEVWKIMSGSASLDGTLDAAPFLEPEQGRPRFGAGGTMQVRFEMTDGRGGGNLAARLLDGKPLVGLVPPGPPKWAAGLLDLHDFRATARLLARPGMLAVSPAHARAGTFSVDADVRDARGRRWGAFLVRKGGLAFGLGLRDGSKSLHLVDAPSWFVAEGEAGGLRTDQPRAAGGAARPSR